MTKKACVRVHPSFAAHGSSEKHDKREKRNARDPSNQWIQKADISTGLAVHAMTNSGVSYNYVIDSFIKTVEPTCGPRSGGTVVRITFAEATQHVMCSFGALIVPANQETNTEISCIAPGGKTGSVQLWINHSDSTSTQYISEFVYMEAEER